MTNKSTIAIQKALLRQTMRQRRLEISPTIKSVYDQRICDLLWSFIIDKECSVVHTFLPMKEEINLYPVINKMLHNNIAVVTSKTLLHGKLEHLFLKDVNQLETGIYGTRHPLNAQQYTGSFDLIVVPGLAFNHDGVRLGYGGGYYDRFLKDYPHVATVSPAYPFQLLDESIPIEQHDVKIDEIIIDLTLSFD